MRRVTRDASVRLNRSMLKSKGPGFIRVTGETGLILRGGRAKLGGQKPAVLVMTVTALQQTFVDAMVKRL